MRAIVGGVLGRIPIPSPAMVVALLALIIAASGAAVAAIPSSDGTITACRDTRTGVLRVINAEGGQTCTSKETQLSWKDGITGKVADSLHADQADNAQNAANADTVDGKHAADFYAQGAKVADSDNLDGQDSSAFSPIGHDHDGRYFTETESNDRFVNETDHTKSAHDALDIDADTVDGKDFSEFGATPVFGDVGPLPKQGTYTSKGGTLIIWASGSGYRSSTNNGTSGPIGMSVGVFDANGQLRYGGGVQGVFANELDSHKAFVVGPSVVTGLPAGQYTIRLVAANQQSCNSGFEEPSHFCTTTSEEDTFAVTVLEIPA